MASEFFQQAMANGYPTKMDGAGNILVTDPTYSTFGVYNPDGTTKTFYKPDPNRHGFPNNRDY